MTLEVFISYSHRDQRLRKELDTHLSSLKRQGVISSWCDGDIVPGSEWHSQIRDHLNTAQIILLLISASFLASKFCFSIEMTRALERHKTNEARVLPIILRPCDWKGAPFAQLQVLPSEGKPVMRWPTHDDAFENVVQGIRRAIDDLTQRIPIAGEKALEEAFRPINESLDEIERQREQMASQQKRQVNLNYGNQGIVQSEITGGTFTFHFPGESSLEHE